MKVARTRKRCHSRDLPDGPDGRRRRRWRKAVTKDAWKLGEWKGKERVGMVDGGWGMGMRVWKWLRKFEAVSARPAGRASMFRVRAAVQ